MVIEWHELCHTKGMHEGFGHKQRVMVTLAKHAHMGTMPGSVVQLVGHNDAGCGSGTRMSMVASGWMDAHGWHTHEST